MTVYDEFPGFEYVTLLCPVCLDFDAEWVEEEFLDYSPGDTYWENWQTFYVCSTCGHTESQCEYQQV